MKIPNPIKQKWQKLKEHGDVNAIAEANDISRQTISGAMNGSGCTMDVFIMIRDFYDKREKKLAKLLAEK